MLETTTSNYSEKKFIPIRQLDFKLPTLQKPNTRGNINSQKQAVPRRRQSNRLLPKILTEDNNQVFQVKNQQNNLSKQIMEQPDTFALEIQQKLKMVLNGKRLESQNIEEQPQQDFQTQINHNRQLIKQLKKKRQTEGNKSDYKTEKKLKIKDKSQRHGSLIEHPQKKQQKIKPKKNIRDQNIRLKTRISSKQQNNIGSIYTQQFSIQKTKQSKQKLQSQPNLLKSDYLFDNIQTFLQNPRFSQNQTMKTTIKRKQSMLDLQKKLKALQTKIDPNEEKLFKLNEPLKIPDIKQHQHTNEWRKIKVQPNKLQVLSSSIDKQMQKVNSYQAKNETFLEKYLQNKRILLQISIHKKLRQQLGK